MEYVNLSKEKNIYVTEFLTSMTFGFLIYSVAITEYLIDRNEI